MEGAKDAVLCSLLREEEQQGNPNLRKHNPAGRQMGRGAWQHTEAETHLPSATQRWFFECVSSKIEKKLFKFHSAWKHLPSFTKKGYSKPAEGNSSPEHLESAEFVQQTIISGEHKY